MTLFSVLLSSGTLAPAIYAASRVTPGDLLFSAVAVFVYAHLRVNPMRMAT